MDKVARKRSEDPVQETLRQHKSDWNKEVSLLIAQLIAFKRGLNGRGEPKVGLPPSSIKNPLPSEIVQYLDQLAGRYEQVVSDAKNIINEQANYAATRRKSRKEQLQNLANIHFSLLKTSKRRAKQEGYVMPSDINILKSYLDKPFHYIHFTDTPELTGLNPKYQYGNAVGIYGYPLTASVLYGLLNKNPHYEFASDRKFIVIYKAKNTNSILNLDEYTKEQLEKDLEKIKQYYIDALKEEYNDKIEKDKKYIIEEQKTLEDFKNNNKKEPSWFQSSMIARINTYNSQINYYQSLLNEVESEVETRIYEFQTNARDPSNPGSQLFSIINGMCSRLGGTKSICFNKVLRQLLGYTTTHDSGSGIIHPNEPAQGATLASANTEILAVIKNVFKDISKDIAEEPAFHRPFKPTEKIEELTDEETAKTLHSLDKIEPSGLIHFINHPNILVRKKVAQLLPEEELVKMINDPEGSVRSEVAKRLPANDISKLIKSKFDLQPEVILALLLNSNLTPNQEEYLRLKTLNKLNDPNDRVINLIFNDIKNEKIIDSLLYQLSRKPAYFRKYVLSTLITSSDNPKVLDIIAKRHLVRNYDAEELLTNSNVSNETYEYLYKNKKYWNLLAHSRNTPVSILFKIITNINEIDKNNLKESILYNILNYQMDRDEKLKYKLFEYIYSEETEMLHYSFINDFFTIVNNDDKDLQLKAAKSNKLDLRIAVAMFTKSPEILAILAGDEEVQVRQNVARNINTPIENLEDLMSDKNTDVRRMAEYTIYKKIPSSENSDIAFISDGLNKSASWWGSRAWAYMKGYLSPQYWYFKDQDLKDRMFLLRISTDFLDKFHAIENDLASKDDESVPNAVYKFVKLLSAFEKMFLPRIGTMVERRAKLLKEEKDNNEKNNNKPKEEEFVGTENEYVAEISGEPESYYQTESGNQERASEEKVDIDINKVILIQSDILEGATLLNILSLLGVDNTDLKNNLRKIKSLADSVKITYKIGKHLQNEDEYSKLLNSYNELFSKYLEMSKKCATQLQLDLNKVWTFSDLVIEARNKINKKAEQTSDENFKKFAHSLLSRWLKRQRLKVFPSMQEKLKLETIYKILSVVEEIDKIQDLLESDKSSIIDITDKVAIFADLCSSVASNLHSLAKMHNADYEEERLDGKVNFRPITETNISRLDKISKYFATVSQSMSNINQEQ